LFLGLLSVEFSLPLRAFGSAFHVAMNGVSAGKKIISLLNTPDPEWGTEIHRGFAATAFAHDRRHSFFGERHIHVFKHFSLSVVRERNVFQPDIFVAFW